MFGYSIRMGKGQVLLTLFEYLGVVDGPSLLFLFVHPLILNKDSDRRLEVLHKQCLHLWAIEVCLLLTMVHIAYLKIEKFTQKHKLLDFLVVWARVRRYIELF